MMAENRRYYWLKLNEDFFDDDTISWIEEQKNGKEYCLFYLKLCLKSLKTGGLLIRNVGEVLIPYDIKKLAEMTNTDHDTAIVAMELFKRIGLVQILDNGEIFLTQLSELVGSETDKAKAMRAKRTREKLAGNNVTKLLPQCSEMLLDIEKEIDIELDTEKEIDKNITTTTIEEEERAENFSTDLSTVMCGQVQTTVDNLKLVKETTAELVVHYWHRALSNRDVEIAFEKLCSYVVTDDTVIGVFDEEKAGLLKSAFELSIRKGAESMNWNYVNAIYDSWSHKGIHNQFQLCRHEVERNRRKELNYV